MFRAAVNVLHSTAVKTFRSIPSPTYSNLFQKGSATFTPYIRAPTSSSGSSLFTIMHPKFLAAMTAATSQTQSFYMPGEWTKHERTLMAIPGTKRNETRPYLKELVTDIANIAAAVSRFEPVTMIVGQSQAGAMRARADRVQGSFGIEVMARPEETLDLWMRDIAPTYVFCNSTGKLAGLDMNFNGWGNRYQHKDTTALASNILKTQNIPIAKTWLVGEGGGIETDGEGTLIAAESSWVNDNRNPGKTRDQITEEFKRVFGVTEVIWTPGIKGKDVTDDHIDSTARFIEPGKVMLSKPLEKDPEQPWWYEAYEKARDILEAAVDAKGRGLEIIEVEEADPSVINPDDTEQVTSYVNYYLPNGGVVMPSFGDKERDKKALAQFKEIFLDREVVQVPLRELLYSGGGIHCSTQQVLAVD